ncbi:T9SS type A sorting domain-containing protein [bacterium]|nr:T9SS type A sorting domain-containing protein [bacterium]
MKNIYVTAVLTLLTLGAIAQNGQLPNGGFENWSDLDIYDHPTDWENPNTNNFQGTPTVIKSTDAQDGTYSCELLSATTVQQDTIFGYVLHGAFDQNGPSNGTPYTNNVDEIQYQYKCNLAPGDTMFVIAIRFTAGVIVGSDVVGAAVGIQSAWTSGSVSLSNGTQDELFLSFVLSNPFGNHIPSPGSWARIDNISMHNAGIEVTNVPDPSFENWTNVSVENPDDWFTLNPLLSGIGTPNAIKTTDANTGSFAIEMTTLGAGQPSADTISSFLSNGPIDLSASTSFQSAPYNASPTSFSGAYKYTPATGDQGFLQIKFTQAGTSLGFQTQTFNASSTWQTFTLPFSIVGTPDSMQLLAFSGNVAGSVLLLDDLSFSGGNVGLDEFSSMNVDIYPNPASTSVMIKAEGNYNYTLIDLSGNIVMSGNDVNGATELDINQLSSGAYFVMIKNDFKSESHKLIVE